jgi:hypothetical protein
VVKVSTADLFSDVKEEIYMKKCPQCNSIFEDENEFCQNDGSTLINSEMSQNPFQSFSSDTPTVITSSNDMPTVVAPNFQTPTPTPKVENSSNMKWVYPLLGLLVGVIVILGFLAFSPQGSKESRSEQSSSSEKKEEKTEQKENTIQSQSEEPIVERPPINNQRSAGVGRFPEGSNRYLTENDIYGKSSWDLRIMRNEIFARHGYIFKNSALRNYFMSQDWYQPKSRNVSAYLSNVEKRNVKFLKSYE